MLADPIPFPRALPAGYEPLPEEPDYDPGRHLALEPPPATVRLAALGYDAAEIAACPSDFAVSAPFRLLSEEGVAALQQVARALERHAIDGGRIQRLVRGGVYRSRFLRDLCLCPEVAAFVSEIAGTPLAPHTMPIQLGHLNYAPADLARAVDKWHHDTVGFDYVLMVSDPRRMQGGRFQYFRGTKREAAALAAAGRLPPDDRIVSPDFPGPGWAVLQQGNMVVHRGARLEMPAERITMVNAYVARDTAFADACRFADLKCVDPRHVLFTEWARHKAWLARGRLDRLIAELPYGEDRSAALAGLRAAAAELEAAIAEIASDEAPELLHYGG